jgi:hypothetical protein
MEYQKILNNFSSDHFIDGYKLHDHVWGHTNPRAGARMVQSEIKFQWGRRRWHKILKTA